MDRIDFYDDKKFCPCCDDYVTYLMSVEHSFCTRCGGEVRLFSKDDWEEFHSEMAAKRPKGGRPRKKAAGAAVRVAGTQRPARRDTARRDSA